MSRRDVERGSLLVNGLVKEKQIDQSPANELPVGLTRECEGENTTNIGDRRVALPNNFPSDQLALVHVLYGL